MDLPLSVYQDRLVRIQDSMGKQGIDALVITAIKRNTVKYLTDFSQPNFLQSSGNCLLVVPSQGNPTLIIQATHFLKKDISTKTWIEDLRLGPSFPAILEECTKVLKWLKADTGCIGILGRELDSLLEMYLKGQLPKAQFVDANPLLDAMRMIKCPEEIDLLREIQEVADIKFRAAMEATQVGATEFEVMAAAEYAGRRLGAEQATCNLISFAPNDDPRLVREPIFRTITSKEVVLFEAIPFYRGYNIELIGVFVPKGVSVSKEQEKLSELCHKSYEAGLAVAKPGAKIADIYRTALAVVQEAGYKEFTHSCGHGIGLDNGEKPDFTLDTDTSPVLLPGMIFAYHPNITILNGPKATFGGVMLVTDSGVEFLSKIEPKPLYYL